MNLRNFFAELKRRNVYKVAVAYAIVGWLLIQVATQVFPFFEIPNWAVRLFVLLLILLFPVALILAWAFELTPEGIKRTEDVDPSRSIRHKTGRKLMTTIIIVVILAASLLGLHFIRKRNAPFAAGSGSQQGVAILAKSIAVLPFDNLSHDKDNAYFADGIQEEILTRLSKIADLRVISRTSTQRYKSSPDNLREIAKQLGVANILEGSVQKVADQVRVNVELIDTTTDAHLWAETYDRKLIDIFSVESDIAKAIADTLRAKLTGSEEKAIAVRPTENAEAYDEYLRGLSIWTQYANSPITAQNAARHFARAAELDPKFSFAWARLSTAHSRVYLSGNDPTPARERLAKDALDKALALQPDSVETLLAKGYFYYWVRRGFEEAAAAFRQAQTHQPNNPEALAAISYIERRQGKLEKALAHQDQVIEMDPRNPNHLTQLSLTYNVLRRSAEAHTALANALNITPDDAQMHAGLARLFVQEGNLEAAQNAMRDVPPTPEFPYIFEMHVRLALMTHRYDDAIKLLTDALARPELLNGLRAGQYSYLFGFSEQLAGHADAARAAYEQARATLETFLLQAPNNPDALIYLGFVYAMLGDKAAALREAHAAIAARPPSLDHIVGPSGEEALARVEALVGENDAAIAELERLFHVSYLGPEQFVLTPAVLRLDPVWNPLRNDPRFQKLCEERKQ